MDRDRNVGAEPSQGLVDRVVDDLKDHVMKPGAVVGITDVHTGPFSNGVKAL